MHATCLEELRTMTATQLVQAIVEAKTEDKEFYDQRLPLTTKRETIEQLEWLIEMLM